MKRVKKKLTKEEKEEREREKQYLQLGSADWFYFIKNWIQEDEYIQMEGNIIEKLKNKAISERVLLLYYRDEKNLTKERELVDKIDDYVNEIRYSIHLLKLLQYILMPISDFKQLKMRNKNVYLRDPKYKSYEKIPEFLLKAYKYVGQGKSPWFARMRKIRKAAEEKTVYWNGEIFNKRFAIDKLKKDIEENKMEIKKNKYRKDYINVLKNEIEDYERRKTNAENQILEYKRKREKHVRTTKRISRNYSWVYKTYFPGFENYTEWRNMMKRALQGYIEEFLGILIFTYSRKKKRSRELQRDSKRQKTSDYIGSKVNVKIERKTLEYHSNHPKVLDMLEENGDEMTEKEILLQLLIEETNEDDYDSEFADKMVNTLAGLGFHVTKDVLLRMLDNDKENIDWYDIATLFIKFKKVDPVKDRNEIRASDMIFKPILL